MEAKRRRCSAGQVRRIGMVLVLVRERQDVMTPLVRESVGEIEIARCPVFRKKGDSAEADPIRTSRICPAASTIDANVTWRWEWPAKVAEAGPQGIRADVVECRLPDD